MATELYTAPNCPHCAAARENLEWRGVEFVEYDVERDAAARAPAGDHWRESDGAGDR
jgi:glutaredoxin 3